MIVIASVAKLDEIVINTLKNKFNAPVFEKFKYVKPTRSSTLWLHIDCQKLALSLFMTRRKSDRMIFWQQFIGLYYGFFSRAMFSDRKKHRRAIILTFIFINRPSFFGIVYKYLIYFSICARCIEQIVCHSSIELEYYRKIFPRAADKFRFCLLGEGKANGLDNNFDNYYFSGGSSNRDYYTIIRAFNTYNKNLIIACKPENLPGIIPKKNIDIRHNAYGMQFTKLIRMSKAVILLVKDTDVSSGQLVILNAMSYGKPLIVSKGNCMSDYIDDSYAIQVEPHSVEDLVQAINRIENNPGVLKKMSVSAYNAYNLKFSIDKYAERIYHLFDQVIS